MHLVNSLNAIKMNSQLTLRFFAKCLLVPVWSRSGRSSMFAVCMQSMYDCMCKWVNVTRVVKWLKRRYRNGSPFIFKPKHEERSYSQLCAVWVEILTRVERKKRKMARFGEFFSYSNLNNKKEYITCLAFRSVRLYLAERECPASTQICSILRILWWTHLNCSLFSRDEYRPVRLFRTTAVSDPTWKNQENRTYSTFVNLFWTFNPLTIW